MLSITELVVKGFGCVDDATLKLTPLHALIGPNDSGKSTLLEAVMWLASLGAEGGARATADASVVGAFSWSRFRIDVSKRGIRALRDDLSPVTLDRDQPWIKRAVFQGAPQFGANENAAAVEDLTRLEGRFGSPRQLRLDPDALRAPRPLLAPGVPVFFETARGGGLAAVLDALRDRGDGGYGEIEKQFLDLFPSVRFLQLARASTDMKVVQVELKNGKTVSAEQMSEGMLYALAFLAVEHTHPASVLVVEEPENGLHPARIADVMRVLRRIAQRTQIILATHSPLVVNELSGEEVSVVVRTKERGTRVVPLSATFNYEERSKVYSNGELWLNHCDGIGEAELLAGPAPVSE